MHPGAVGAAPDSSTATPPHLGHSYAPRPIPAPHPSYSPVALPFPSIADGGLQVRVMPPSQHSCVARHLPLCWRWFPHPSGCAALSARAPGGCHCIPVRYAVHVSVIAPSCRDAGRRWRCHFCAGCAGTTPPCPITETQHPSRCESGNQLLPCAARSTDPAPPHLPALRGDTCSHAHPPAVVQRWRHRDKPPPQVHGTLDGALAAA
ncbi:hypothetical protein DFH08DRAFT_976319 [Mycena albidolilacea]|uniref:Uncharacterized protein n=1 Tax=Mycena albidolilacea TaxID=1033008 RepID=A0AAD7E9H7_9AGAR|nr:hypothetical protein DFH08DRAFT_976319 [Mycena albidolilacea]